MNKELFVTSKGDSISPKEQGIQSACDAIRRIWKDKICGGMRTTIEGAIEAGNILDDLKEKCNHGEWMPFVEANFDFGYDAANDYINCYKNRAKLDRSPNLTIKGFAALRDTPCKPARARVIKAEAAERRLSRTAKPSKTVPVEIVEIVREPKVEQPIVIIDGQKRECSPTNQLLIALRQLARVNEEHDLLKITEEERGQLRSGLVMIEEVMMDIRIMANLVTSEPIVCAENNFTDEEKAAMLAKFENQDKPAKPAKRSKKC